MKKNGLSIMLVGLLSASVVYLTGCENNRNSQTFYDYQIEAEAVGVYKNEDGVYFKTVAINGTDYEVSDGAWDSIAYSAITPPCEVDIAVEESSVGFDLNENGDTNDTIALTIKWDLPAYQETNRYYGSYIGGNGDGLKLPIEIIQ